MWKKWKKATDTLPDLMKIAKLNIVKQASMAVIAVAITGVLIFAISVAWYSNVIHTEGLIFTASSWKFDFEGAIQIGTDVKEAAPGDSGIVSMQLNNTSDEAITVLVNATKDANMTEVMQKRLYFYVDDSQLINGEMVERIYVNETDEYAYTVLGNNTLTLSQEYHNDAFLKWEWVYDVLGYYVSGSRQEDGTVLVDDYMKPVIYDLDKATFDGDGNLITVNGGVSRANFLQELFLTDGYKGGTVSTPTQAGYYPVVVDEASGYGIWLYLCTKGEIEMATAWDNALSSGDTQGEEYTFSGRLLLSGQQKREAEIQVSNPLELTTQLNTDQIDKVTLAGNMTLSDTLVLESGKQVVLDLNGKTLKVAAGINGIDVKEGSSLTVINGTIESAGSGSGYTAAIHTAGGEITLNNVVMNNVERGVHVEDQKAVGLDSRVRISNCTMNVSEVAVLLRGNGDTTARKTYLLIENSTLISSEDIAIYGNGSQWGTAMEIIGSTIEGDIGGIFHPQKESTLLLKNSTLKGGTGIYLKGGYATIYNSFIQGTRMKQEPVFQGSGATDTGDGIYIETNYEVPITLDVSGVNTVIQSTYSYAIQVYEADAPQVSVRVTEGKYSSDMESFLPEGYKQIELADGTYQVGNE